MTISSALLALYYVFGPKPSDTIDFIQSIPDALRGYNLYSIIMIFGLCFVSLTDKFKKPIRTYLVLFTGSIMISMFLYSIPLEFLWDNYNARIIAIPLAALLSLLLHKGEALKFRYSSRSMALPTTLMLLLSASYSYSSTLKWSESLNDYKMQMASGCSTMRANDWNGRYGTHLGSPFMGTLLSALLNESRDVTRLISIEDESVANESACLSVFIGYIHLIGINKNIYLQPNDYFNFAFDIDDRENNP